MPAHYLVKKVNSHADGNEQQIWQYVWNEMNLFSLNNKPHPHTSQAKKIFFKITSKIHFKKFFVDIKTNRLSKNQPSEHFLCGTGVTSMHDTSLGLWQLAPIMILFRMRLGLCTVTMVCWGEGSGTDRRLSCRDCWLSDW